MNERRRRIVIVGATSAIAEHCARRWVAAGPVDLVLIGRDLAKTERIAEDLRVRGPASSIVARVGDFVDPRAIAALVGELAAAGPIDIALIAHGSLPDQSTCQADPLAADEALRINAMSPVAFAEAFAGHMERAGRGRIGILGSVAGDRGRKSNYVYGSAKGLVARYAQGLQHRLAATAVRVTMVKPGPTDTPMTAQLKASGAKLATVDEVADAIVRGIDAGKPTVYAPAKWAVIMMVVRHLPAFVFNKMNI